MRFLVEVDVGTPVERIPMPLTDVVVARGRERFNIYCSPCHGVAGDGDGMIVKRGYKRPTSYHDPRLRNERAGYFFDVITNGFGQMSGYAPQITPEDRWAVVAWVKTLQASQNMPREFLVKEDEGKLDAKAAASEAGAMAQKSFLEGENGAAAAPPAPGAAAAAPEPHSPSKKSSSSSSSSSSPSKPQ